LKRSVPEQTIINPATSLLWWPDIGLALTAAPINDPVLNAAKKVVIKLVQTKIEFPKNGARTRDATSCKPMLSIPRQKTNRNRMNVMPARNGNPTL
jgi:hypothetical protein